MKIKRIIAAVTAVVLIGGASPVSANTGRLVTACADEETNVSTKKDEVSAEADSGKVASEENGENGESPETVEADESETATPEADEADETESGTSVEGGSEEECSAVFETEDTEGGVIIKRVTDIKGDTLVIPAEIDGKPVVEVDPHAFLYTDPSNVVSLKVECSLQDLGFLYVSSFSSLEKIEIGEGIVKLDKREFNYCKNLKSIHLPDSLEEIGDSEFLGNRALEEVYFGKGLKRIGSQAFCGCNLKSVVFPDSLEVIGDQAFCNCYDLKYVECGSGLKTITGNAFEKDFNLKEVKLNEGLEKLGFGAFNDCYSLKEVNIPTTLKKIESHTFCNTSINNIIIPANIEEIETNAFVYFPQKDSDIELTPKNSLVRETMIIPKNEEETGITVLNPDCELRSSALTTSYDLLYGYEGSTAESYCKYNKGVRFRKLVKSDSSRELKAFIPMLNLYKLDDETVILPAEVDGYPVTELGWLPCLIDKTYDLSNIKTFIIEGNVRKIDYHTIEAFQSLENLEIGEGITSIEYSTLTRCSDLRTIKLPDSLEVIGEDTFSHLQNLETVKLGNGLKTIEDHAFFGCYSLSDISFPDSLETIGEWAFFECYSLSEIKFGSGLESIGDSAFSNCCSLAEIKFGSGLKSIGESAFSEDYNIKKLDLNDGLEKIGEGAFAHCYLLEEVNIPNTLKKIEKLTFYDTNINSIVLPESVEFVGEVAFNHILNKVNESETRVMAYENGERVYKDLVIPKKTEDITVKIYNPLCELDKDSFGSYDKIYGYRFSTAEELFHSRSDFEYLDEDPHIFNAGDANCDGITDMSDAVLIMQTLANPNKYGINGTHENHITAMGVRRGDVDKSHEGLTSNDALKIQEYLLGKINTFDNWLN